MDEAEIIAALKVMEADPTLITKPAFRANKDLWPNNKISFIDAHLSYLKARPTISPQHYLSNLRLMLRREP